MNVQASPKKPRAPAWLVSVFCLTSLACGGVAVDAPLYRAGHDEPEAADASAGSTAATSAGGSAAQSSGSAATPVPGGTDSSRSAPCAERGASVGGIVEACIPEGWCAYVDDGTEEFRVWNNSSAASIVKFWAISWRLCSEEEWLRGLGLGGAGGAG